MSTLIRLPFTLNLVLSAESVEECICFLEKKIVGRNSGFKIVSAETEIRECFERNYLNFRAFILPLLSGERAAFGKTEKLQVVSRTKTTASFCENGSK